ncbi:MAG TPA: hypothetical protein VG271_11700, partial [Beijerinckiaceae bacterium]|nr:hypothetical protein [Beijerinckiaceae bacterium]
VNVLVCHARTPRDMVRAVVSAIVAQAEELVRVNALFAGLPSLFEPLRTEGAAALAFEGVALHEGAVDAYREAGLLG